MSNFKQSIARVINEVPREFKAPVMQAFDNSDGTYLNFEQELTAQVWDHPELPIQDILDRLTALA